MITDKDIARICASSYDPSFKWDTLWDGTNSGGIYAGLLGNVLCFRGSDTLQDWFRDLKAEAVYDYDLGGLHAGFAEGMSEFFGQVIHHISPDTIVCGHSLGAARACILAGHMIANNIDPVATVTFGCPRPGFKQLSDILSCHPIRSYKNRRDLVTDVPVELPGLPFVDAAPFIHVDVQSSPDDFGLFADHHIELYVAGVSV